MIKLRVTAHKRFKNSQNIAHWSYHKEFRNYVNATIFREKKAYVEFALRQNNSKITWNRLRTLEIVDQKSSYEIPPELKNAQDINSHFISIPSIDKTEGQSRLLPLPLRTLPSNSHQLQNMKSQNV
ncbi:hypothetical protein JTB14_005393 [Gonioctena quinquepunctata]|nr:hypothetical protein JTB14_005393 [Gonioctena quinquepunctata]